MFIICKKCVEAQIIVKAPKSYNDVVEYQKCKYEPYKVQYHINKYLKNKCSLLSKENYKYDQKLKELIETRNDLINNCDIEKAKINELNKFKKEMDKLGLSLKTQGLKQMDFINKMSMEFATNSEKMFNNIHSQHSQLLNNIKQGCNQVELMCQNKKEPENMCSICCTNKLSKAFIPCGHITCSECCGKLTSENNMNGLDLKCPICRTIVENTLHIYLE